MDKNPPARFYGVLGYPARHSLSPLMHNAAFKALQISAEYRLFEIKPEELEYFLANIDKNNIWGLNITIPYKERILDFVKLDSETFYLSQIKAINTIVRREGAWKGFNTDIPGFSRHLKENFDPIDKRVAVLGAGGAGRAVAYVLASLGAKEVCVFDIDENKSNTLVDMVKNLFPGFKIYSVPNIQELDIRSKDLLVNATPIGLKESDPCPVTPEMLHKNLFCYDLIYNPGETKLLALAKKIGAKTSNGLGMLLYQGALSFEQFTGKKAPIDVMRRALNEGVKKI